MRIKNRTPRRTLIDERDAWRRWCNQAEKEVERRDQLIYEAWCVIANANGGHWIGLDPDWVDAAKRWRNDAFAEHADWATIVEALARQQEPQR